MDDGDTGQRQASKTINKTHRDLARAQVTPSGSNLLLAYSAFHPRDLCHTDPSPFPPGSANCEFLLVIVKHASGPKSSTARTSLPRKGALRASRSHRPPHGGCGIPLSNSEHGKPTVDSHHPPDRMTLSLLVEVSQYTLEGGV